MDIELLKTFLEVHRTRHFGKAADSLFLTSAAVSARIKQLEQHLGVTLFVRGRRNVQLTNEGERLLPHAENLILTWSRTMQALSMEKSKSSRLHIGATFSLWQMALQEKLIALSRDMPTLAFLAEGHPDTELMKRLEDRLLDVVLHYDPRSAPELQSIKVGQLKLVLASTSPDATVRSCLDKGYIYVDWGTSFAVFHAKRFGEIPPAALQVNLVSIAMSFLSKNAGAAYLPASLIDQTPSLHLVNGASSLTRPIFATYREGTDQPEVIRAVIDFLQGISI